MVDAGWITRVLCKVSRLAGYSHSFFKKKRKKKRETKNKKSFPGSAPICNPITWEGEVGVESGMRVGSGQADLLCITNVS